jgi:hypothetical protein
MHALILCLVLLAATGCDKTAEQATDHLHSIGYKNVGCSDERGLTTCIADGVRFRCAVADAGGCQSGRPVACERFYLERPVP